MSTPLTFTAVGFSNFMATGQVEQVVDLGAYGTTAIEGRNLDAGGSNGAGKTTILNALCYALFNKPFDQISLNRLVNATNAKKTLMTVWARFQRGDDEYEIRRTRGSEISIAILKNGEDLTPGKGAAECDAMIREIIGVSYELFTRTVIFSGNAPPFLGLPAKEQRDQVEELFSITALSEKAERLKALAKATEADVKVREAVDAAAAATHATHARLVADAAARVYAWDEARTARVERLAAQVAELERFDEGAERAAHARVAELERLGRDLRDDARGVKARAELIAAEASPVTAELAAAAAQRRAIAERTCDAAALLPQAERELAAKRAEVNPETKARAVTEAARNPIPGETWPGGAKLTTLARDRADLEASVGKLLAEQEHLADAKCPYCSQSWVASKARLAEVTAKIEAEGARLLGLDDREAEIRAEEAAWTADRDRRAAELDAQLADAVAQARAVEAAWEEARATAVAELEAGVFALRAELAGFTERQRALLAEHDASTAGLRERDEAFRADWTARAAAALAQVASLTQAADDNDRELAAARAALRYATLEAMAAETASLEATRRSLAEARGEANPHAAALEELVASAPEPVDPAVLDGLKRRLEHQKFLVKLLTGQDSFVRRRIVNKTVPFLNERINHYAHALGLPHTVTFHPDITCTLSEFGRELDFGNLSAGEKKRVNVALALAFRDVFHRLHARSNLLLIDELDGQLDGQGIDAIVRLLKEKGRDEEMSIFVISHHPNVQGRLDRTLTVTKVNGFSSLELT
jgi:energy-coupling factor transporter ATP-binding protein EcfA2